MLNKIKRIYTIWYCIWSLCWRKKLSNSNSNRRRRRLSLSYTHTHSRVVSTVNKHKQQRQPAPSSLAFLLCTAIWRSVFDCMHSICFRCGNCRRCLRNWMNARMRLYTWHQRVCVCVCVCFCGVHVWMLIIDARASIRETKAATRA